MAYQGLLQLFGPLIRKKIRSVTGFEHLPAHPPFILAGNHVGYLDGLALGVHYYDQRHSYIYFLTTEGMWRLFGAYLSRHWLKMVPIFERDPSHKADSLSEAAKILKKKEVIGIFPEGTRNPDSTHLLRGKTGAVRLALATGAPIIPFGTLNNTGHRLGEAFRSFWQKNRYLELHFGRPLDLSEFTGRPIDKDLLVAATNKLMKAISSLCGKKYNY